MLRRRECALELARLVGAPEHASVLWHDVDGEFPDPAGKGRLFHADLAMVAFAEGERASEALAGLLLEPQLAVDPSRGIAWPIYWVTLRTRHECPVAMIVVSPLRRVVEWARDELFEGEPRVLHAIGRDQVEPVLDLERALANPAWAAFTAALHARGPHARASAEILIRACASLPAEDRRCYLGLLYAGMRKRTMNTIQASIPEALKYELTEYERQGGWFQNGLAEGEAKGLAEGEAKGLAEGERKSLLRVLSRRGITLTAEQREVVEACTDEEQLGRWLDRALEVDSAEALFADAG
ncbi:hypothetical protein ACNOYE_25905 [Nannocystaceae bacterium ST9]